MARLGKSNINLEISISNSGGQPVVVGVRRGEAHLVDALGVEEVELVGGGGVEADGEVAVFLAPRGVHLGKIGRTLSANLMGRLLRSAQF